MLSSQKIKKQNEVKHTMAMFNVKPQSIKVLLYAALALAVVYGAFMLGYEGTVPIAMAVIGITLGAILVIEAGWKRWLMASSYKRLRGEEVANFLTFGIGIITITTAALFIPQVNNAAPTVLVTWLKNISTFGTIAAVVLVIRSLLTKN